MTAPVRPHRSKSDTARPWRSAPREGRGAIHLDWHRSEVLPDVLAPELRVIFCGSAAGTASARAGAYYAGPGNRFWEILCRVGLTPRLLQPQEFRSLLALGIGLTDLAKHGFGPDRALAKNDDDAPALAAKIARFGPSALAFVGKRPAQIYLGRSGLAYGRQTDSPGPTTIFVLPSTSGAARGFWDEAPWFALARWLRGRAASEPDASVERRNRP